MKREARVIAFAGILQGCRLVHDLATQGRADAQATQISLASIFRIDADDAADRPRARQRDRLQLRAGLVVADQRRPSDVIDGEQIAGQRSHLGRNGPAQRGRRQRRQDHRT